MPELVTLELSEDVVQRARQTADRTGRAVEGVLAEWVERGAVALAEIPGGVAGTPAQGAYPVFTPYHNEPAAQVLLDALRAAEAEVGKAD